MKKELIKLLVIIIMCLSASYFQTHYEREATVASISNNIITVVDKGDNLWEFVSNDNYSKGEKVILKMHTNNTDRNIYDDIIEDVIRINN